MRDANRVSGRRNPLRGKTYRLRLLLNDKAMDLLQLLLLQLLLFWLLLHLQDKVNSQLQLLLLQLLPQLPDNILGGLDLTTCH